MSQKYKVLNLKGIILSGGLSTNTKKFIQNSKNIFEKYLCTMAKLIISNNSKPQKKKDLRSNFIRKKSII